MVSDFHLSWWLLAFYPSWFCCKLCHFSRQICFLSRIFKFEVIHHSLPMQNLQFSFTQSTSCHQVLHEINDTIFTIIEILFIISHICGICIIPIGKWLVARQYVQVLVVSVLPSMPGFPRALVWTILCAVLASGDHNLGGKLHKLTLQRYFGFNYMTSCMAGTENPPVPLKASVIRMLAGFLANMVEFEHCTWIFPWQVLSLLTKLLLLFTPSSLGFCFWHCVD